MSSGGAAENVREALLLAHKAADSSAELVRAAERNLERSRRALDGAERVAAIEAVKDARHAQKVARDAIVAADRVALMVAQGAEAGIDAALNALALSRYAAELVDNAEEVVEEATEG